MGKFYDDIPPHIIEWVEKQHMFTVATAPLSATGHVNVSTKGVGGTFHVVDSKTVWYEDLTGSGSETIAHLRENGRITILFSAFEGPPVICRVFGTGKVHEFGSPEYSSYAPPANRTPGSRSVIVVDVHKVGTSCGFGVPFYEFIGHRETLLNTASMFEKRDLATPDNIADNGLKAYWRRMNSESIDGLPALTEVPHQSHLPLDAVHDYSKFGVTKKTKKNSDDKVEVKVKGLGSAWISGDEVKLALAFLFGAIISTFFARITGKA
ncbi:hypothetical protein NEOLEDRAFT_1135235 [Neolentinus lepideus HHB14362 ss-1]|uniref:Pyridoxamine 5'-phosphate oxidase N-terminal domain-containing protein n=1 Tax=Neolentinus lepideus HHB14362 ss-1 TaxID=1314782 RepID=A0A165RXN4_9AGAM|nr:hypothetical protein NEOLEDRAFT_1135235 [Neolentinus lepideus HHB14362 ss-1]